MAKNEPPDIIVVLVALLFSLLIWAFVISMALRVVFPISEAEKLVESQLDPFSPKIIVGNSAFLANCPPVYIKPQVLGSLAGLSASQEMLLDKLWLCESSRRHEGIWGDDSRAFGGFQFHQPTFNQYCEGSRENFYDQLECAERMVFQLGIGHTHWKNCFRRYNLNQYLAL